jgi:succinoglycan biosynthesis protein ExoM
MNNQTPSLTVCICTFNRCDRLKPLVSDLRKQTSPIPFDILVINNNSTDQTEEVLQKLTEEEGIPLRYVTESEQGISYARNRAISECLDKEFMLFMDDDETPAEGLINAAIDALINENADCVGGRIEVCFGETERPHWFSDSLMGFLGKHDYGTQALWISDKSKPLWTGNIAYNMAIFKDNPSLRFDLRYNRKGEGVGGGEDVVMFGQLVDRKYRIRYRPEMIVNHHIDNWKIKRSYFLKLHFRAGINQGRYELEEYGKTIFGIPVFLFNQAVKQTLKWLKLGLKSDPETMRQGMNVAHALGLICGCFLNWKE